MLCSLYACQKNKNIAIPEDKINIEKSKPTENKDTIVVYDTKLPFVQIPDSGFEAYLIILNIDKDNQINGKIAVSDIQNIDSLNIFPVFYFPENKDSYESFIKKKQLIYDKYKEIYFNSSQDITIKSMQGIEYFINLKYLNTNCEDSLDLSKNLNLTYLEARKPQFKFLNISNCKKLKVLDVGAGYRGQSFPSILGNIDFTQNTNLTEIHYTGQTPKLDLSKNINLKILDVRFSYFLKDLDLKECEKLESISSYNCRELANICLSSRVISKIDTITTITKEGIQIPLWQRDSWTKWVVCK